MSSQEKKPANRIPREVYEIQVPVGRKMTAEEIQTACLQRLAYSAETGNEILRAFADAIKSNSVLIKSLYGTVNTLKDRNGQVYRENAALKKELAQLQEQIKQLQNPYILNLES